MKNVLLFTTTAAAVVMLAACSPQGPGGNNGSATNGAAGDTPSASASPSSPAGTPASPPASSPQAEPALCKSSQLQASMQNDVGGGAAGSVYMKLVLTNSGSTNCLLKGFPGVSFTSSPDGSPIGMPARRDDTVPAVGLVLGPGHSGKATLRYIRPGNIPECTTTPAEGFRVYPPEDTASLFIAQKMVACSNSNVELLTISTFQAA